MKKIPVLIITALVLQYTSSAQQIGSKERAAYIAKEDFSKSKYKKAEKFGITKELSKTIISTPAIKQNVKEYGGVYKVNGHGYILTLKIDEQKNIAGTINEASSTGNSELCTLKRITIEDALFKAVKVAPNGEETPVEGVFIDKNDNGSVEFGLGIKLPKSITIKNDVSSDKLFFKKVD